MRLAGSATPTSRRATLLLSRLPMAPQETVKTRKRRGPAPTGKGHFLGLRVQPELMTALDAWIERHPDPKPTRSDAVRAIMTDHLAAHRLLPSRPDLRKSKTQP